MALERTVLCDVARDRTVLCDVALERTVLCDVARNRTVLCDVALERTVLCHVARDRTVLSVMWPTRQAPVVSHVLVRRGSGARATRRGILSACCSFIGAAAASALRFVSPLYCSRQESGLQASGKRSG